MVSKNIDIVLLGYCCDCSYRCSHAAGVWKTLNLPSDIADPLLFLRYPVDCFSRARVTFLLRAQRPRVIYENIKLGRTSPDRKPLRTSNSPKIWTKGVCGGWGEGYSGVVKRSAVIYFALGMKCFRAFDPL